MMRTATGSVEFATSTTTTGFLTFKNSDQVEACANPMRRVLLEQVGVVRRTHGANVFVDATLQPSEETTTASLTEFARELGLEEDVRQARRDLAVEISEGSGRESLKTLRLRAGLSQRELAVQVGTSQPRIAAVEAGRSGMGLAFARRIAQTLNVSLDEIADAGEGN